MELTAGPFFVDRAFGYPTTLLETEREIRLVDRYDVVVFLSQTGEKEDRKKTFEVDVDDGFHYLLNLIPIMIISILSLPSTPKPQTTQSPTHPSP